MIEFKGSHFEREIVLWGVRWYVAYPISYRQLEEMMEERGGEVDHSTLNRWVLKYVPLLDQAFRLRKRRVGGSWRMDGHCQVNRCGDMCSQSDGDSEPSRCLMNAGLLSPSPERLRANASIVGCIHEMAPRPEVTV